MKFLSWIFRADMTQDLVVPRWWVYVVSIYIFSQILNAIVDYWQAVLFG